MNGDKRTKTTTNSETDDDETTQQGTSIQMLNQIIDHSARFTSSTWNSTQYRGESAICILAETRRVTSTRFGSPRFITPCGGLASCIHVAERTFDKFISSCNEPPTHGKMATRMFDEVLTPTYGSFSRMLTTEYSKTMVLQNNPHQPPQTSKKSSSR